ncbi:hypothetical protein DL93DRAFT_2077021 [Clavulina sp. PMI_390]|nr:hypothetical protein DL93DRAFT_2077021 [Clavulina sp. PMI_390]
MALYKTGVSSPVKGQEGEAAARKLATKIRGIEGRYAPLADASDEASEGDNAHGWLAAGAVGQESLSNTVFAENNDSLGTIGGGNHFAELQAVDEIRDPALFAQYISQPTSESTAPVDTSRLFLLVHSGSRGVGQAILASTRSETQKGSLPLFSGTPDFENYMALHDDACRWARCNRDLIAHRILGCVDSSYAADCGEQIGTGSEGKHISAVVKDRKVLDIWHNNVEKRSWPTTSDTSETEDPATQQEAWLHRKGAAPSDKGLVVIPGSRGAHSYLVLPVGPQHANGFSLAHGAGRALTRSKALATAGSKYSSSNSSAGSSVSRLQTTSLHSTVICEEKELLFEEIPEAYKDIDAVVKDLEDSGIVKVVAVMRPVVTYKIRKEER